MFSIALCDKYKTTCERFVDLLFCDKYNLQLEISISSCIVDFDQFITTYFVKNRYTTQNIIDRMSQINIKYNGVFCITFGL